MTLAQDVLRAFERACAEGDMDVAEKLLQTLEVIEAREEAGGPQQSLLTRAYLTVAQEPLQRTSGKRRPTGRRSYVRSFS